MTVQLANHLYIPIHHMGSNREAHTSPTTEVEGARY